MLALFTLVRLLILPVFWPLKDIVSSWAWLFLLKGCLSEDFLFSFFSNPSHLHFYYTGVLSFVAMLVVWLCGQQCQLNDYLAVPPQQSRLKYFHSYLRQTFNFTWGWILRSLVVLWLPLPLVSAATLDFWWNILINVWWIVMDVDADIHVPLEMNCNRFSSCAIIRSKCWFIHYFSFWPNTCKTNACITVIVILSKKNFKVIIPKGKFRFFWRKVLLGIYSNRSASKPSSCRCLTPECCSV